MKTVHHSMIRDRSPRVSTRILKPGPGPHLLASALAGIAILLVLPIITDKAAAQLTILHSFGDGSVSNDGPIPRPVSFRRQMATFSVSPLIRHARRIGLLA